MTILWSNCLVDYYRIVVVCYYYFKIKFIRSFKYIRYIACHLPYGAYTVAISIQRQFYSIKDIELSIIQYFEMIIHVDYKHMKFSLNEWVSTRTLKIMFWEGKSFQWFYKFWLFLNSIFRQLGTIGVFRISHKIKTAHFKIA